MLAGLFKARQRIVLDGIPISPIMKPAMSRKEAAMSPKRVTSVPGLFGSTNHYDENGNLISYSTPGLFGGTDYYDANGAHTGYSTPNLISGNTFYGDGDDAGIFGNDSFDDDQ